MTTLIDVHLPHMGVVEQAVLTAWLRSPGDRVQESDPLCEVSTDKVDTEVVSPAAGILIDYVAQIDDEVPVGAVIARFAPLDASEAEVAAALCSGQVSTPEPPSDADQPTPTATPRNNGRKPDPVPARSLAGLPADASLVLRAAWLPTLHAPEGASTGLRGTAATPLVRKLARDWGLDLTTVAGTGAGGRITRKDLEKAKVAPIPPPEALPATGSAQADVSGIALPSGYDSVPYDAVAHTPARRAIARNLAESVSTAPQVTAQADVDMSTLAKVRAAVNERRRSSGAAKLSFLPFIARAVCATVAEHPDLNATFTDDHLLRWRPVHLGVAVDGPQGLLVPVIRDAERLTVVALADAITRVSALVRDRAIGMADLAGGTITISNSGSVGGVTATPILTRPQVASVGVPAIIRAPVAATAPNGDEYVTIRPVARLGLTFDHRAFDGAAALRALLSIQHKLETWAVEAYL